MTLGSMFIFQVFLETALILHSAHLSTSSWEGMEGMGTNKQTFEDYPPGD